VRPASIVRKALAVGFCLSMGGLGLPGCSSADVDPPASDPCLGAGLGCTVPPSGGEGLAAGHGVPDAQQPVPSDASGGAVSSHDAGAEGPASEAGTTAEASDAGVAMDASPDAAVAAQDAATNEDAAAQAPGPVTVYIAGDSTVSSYPDTPRSDDQAGWGQMLHEQFGPLVTIANHAIGGRTSRRFIDEGRLDAIASEIAPGDYLLVQFGTNDGHPTATYEHEGQTIPYYLDPATDFKVYLRAYIDMAREHDATLVFVTPPPRNSAYCTGGNGVAAHAQAMRELAAEQNVPLADLNQKTVTYLQNICPAPKPEDFFLVRPDGSVDGTHFQEHGARVLSGFVADGIDEAGLPLAAQRL